jgi:hypothetical protein
MDSGVRMLFLSFMKEYVNYFKEKRTFIHILNICFIFVKSTSTYSFTATVNIINQLFLNSSSKHNTIKAIC